MRAHVRVRAPCVQGSFSACAGTLLRTSFCTTAHKWVCPAGWESRATDRHSIARQVTPLHRFTPCPSSPRLDEMPPLPSPLPLPLPFIAKSLAVLPAPSAAAVRVTQADAQSEDNVPEKSARTTLQLLAQLFRSEPMLNAVMSISVKCMDLTPDKWAHREMGFRAMGTLQEGWQAAGLVAGAYRCAAAAAAAAAASAAGSIRPLEQVAVGKQRVP